MESIQRRSGKVWYKGSRNEAGTVEYRLFLVISSSIVIPTGAQDNRTIRNYTSYKQYCCISIVMCIFLCVSNYTPVNKLRCCPLFIPWLSMCPQGNTNTVIIQWINRMIIGPYLRPHLNTIDFHVKVCHPVNESVQSQCPNHCICRYCNSICNLCIRSFVDHYSTIAGGHSKQASGSRYHVHFISLIQVSNFWCTYISEVVDSVHYI